MLILDAVNGITNEELSVLDDEETRGGNKTVLVV